MLEAPYGTPFASMLTTYRGNFRIVFSESGLRPFRLCRELRGSAADPLLHLLGLTVICMAGRQVSKQDMPVQDPTDVFGKAPTSTPGDFAFIEHWLLALANAARRSAQTLAVNTMGMVSDSILTTPKTHVLVENSIPPCELYGKTGLTLRRHLMPCSAASSGTAPQLSTDTFPGASTLTTRSSYPDWAVKGARFHGECVERVPQGWNPMQTRLLYPKLTPGRTTRSRPTPMAVAGSDGTCHLASWHKRCYRGPCV